MKPPLSEAELNALRALDSCALANAIESFGTRLRNEGFAGNSIRCLFPRLGPMLGYAATVRIRGANPPTGGRTYQDRTDWWDYILSVPAPRVVAVEDVSSSPGLGALLGETHAAILRALGCVGAVTNGSVRDLPAVEGMGFHLFAASPSVSHAYIHIVEFGTPVELGGLAVRSGDLLQGDLHGIQSIPVELAARLPEKAAALRRMEEALLALCRSPGFTIEKLRAAVGGPWK